MAIKIPTFADLGFRDPSASTPGPTYPANDPGAEALGTLGKGLQTAGGAIADYAAEAERRRDKLNESNATLDLFTRLSPLQTKIELETDTDKIAEHRAEINALLQTSGNALAGNPARQKAWMANHTKTILEANKDADKRTTLLYRNKSTAESNVLLDRVTTEGVGNADAQAFNIALEGIETNLKYQVDNGNKLPEAAYEEGKRRRKELVEGRVLNLLSKGKIVEAQALLDTRGDLIADSIQRGNFQLRIDAKAETIGTDAAANRALGLTPALPPSAGQSPRSGGWGPHAGIAATELKKIGWSDAAIQGALANGLAEGGFAQPWQKAWGAEESYGHWQLYKNGELPDYLANEGKRNPEDTGAQARFLARRMEEIQPGFSKISDSKQATDVIALKFEKYKGAAAGQRYGQLAEAARRMGGQRDAADAGDQPPVAGTLTKSPTDSTPMHYARLPGGGWKLAEGPAPQAVRPIPTGPNVNQPPAVTAPPNRTGLPTLVEIEQSIATDPGLATDRAREIAFEKAKRKYSAFEADAARAERIATAAQKAAVDARITEIQKDAYSDNPTISARDIVGDSTFNSDPKLREHMIGFINNPPGSAVPAPQSYAAALRVIERIRLPEGDPQKITDLNQLYDPLLAGKLNKDDFGFVVKQFADIRTPGGELFNKRKTDFLKSVEASIDKSNPLMGKMDPSGKQQLYGFHWLLDQKIDEYRKVGKNPADLLDPSKSEFMGKPETLEPYQKTLQQSTADRVKALTGDSARRAVPTPEPPPRMTPGAGATAIPGGISVPIPPMAIEPRKPGETPDEYLRRIGQ